MKYLHKYASETAFTKDYNDNTVYNEPWVSSVVDGEVAYNKDYLTFEIVEGGDIVWAHGYSDAYKKTIQYSLNGGEWTDLVSTTAGTSFSVASGDVVRFRGDNSSYGNRYYTYAPNFGQSTASFNLCGDLKFMLKNNKNTEDYTFKEFFKGAKVIDASQLKFPENCSSYCYESMFSNCTSLTSAPELPAATLANSCYYGMFSNCTSLTAAPELPATTLISGCYKDMFRGCTSLTKTPELPATTLAPSCYQEMFSGCTSLIAAPELPATTLAESCYNSMFSGCKSLTTAPELPATTLAESCYNSMFYYCKALATAPALPATTLAESCYNSMFVGCSTLNYIKCLATDIPTSNCTYSWVYRVKSTGTFVKNPNMTSWTTGASGIPNNWTVVDA